MPDPGRVSAVRRPGPAPAEGARVLKPAGPSPGPGGRTVAVDDLGLVLVPRGRRPVGVEDDGPAPLVDDDLMVKEAEQGTIFDAGRAAVGPVPGHRPPRRGGACPVRRRAGSGPAARRGSPRRSPSG